MPLGTRLPFLLSPMRNAEAAQHFFEKALPCLAGSAPQTSTLEKQVTPSRTPAAPDATQSAPRVITVEKNAASPTAIAQLKATGMLAEAVERETWSTISTI